MILIHRTIIFSVYQNLDWHVEQICQGWRIADL